MVVGKKSIIENVVCVELSRLLSERGFTDVERGEENFFRRRKDGITCTVIFHLSGRGTYYSFSQAYVDFEDLRAVLRNLLIGTKFENASIVSVGNLTDGLSNYWPKYKPSVLANLDGVNDFVQTYMECFAKIENQFFIPYSDEARVAHECTLFYTKWPCKIGALGSARLLIAYGIKHEKIDLIKLGIERIDAKFSHCNTDEEREFMLSVRDKALEFLSGGGR